MGEHTVDHEALSKISGPEFLGALHDRARKSNGRDSLKRPNPRRYIDTPEDIRLEEELKREEEAAHAAAPSLGEPDEPAPAELPYVDLSLPLKSRDWLVHERIPMLNVTLVSGEGAGGKSILFMQLAGSTVLGKQWIGMAPAEGPALYVSCEEDGDEVNRRMEDVALHLGSTRQEMIERGLRILSFAGRDAVLGKPDRNGVIWPTRLFIQITVAALELRPKLIVIDTVADTFAGDEVKRAQVRQFITLLRGLAIKTRAAVVLIAHPSLTGIATDTGLSGSTGWHNSVRARAYFKTAPGDNPALRALEFRKNNYGPPDAPAILLHWQNGVYAVDPNASLDRIAAEAGIEQVFLQILRRFTEQGRTVSDKHSSTYAPSEFAKEPEAKESKLTKEMLEDAMRRLFAIDKIAVVKEGRPSHRTGRIVETAQAANDQPTPRPMASRRQPTPANREGGTTPLIPPTPSAGGQRALADAPPRPDGADPEGSFTRADPRPSYEVVGAAPAGERCTLCGGGSPRPKRIKRNGEVNIWHPKCADDFVAGMSHEQPESQKE